MSTRAAVDSDKNADRKDRSKPSNRERVEAEVREAHGASAHGYTKEQGYSRNIETIETPEAVAQGAVKVGRYSENANVEKPEDGFANAARRAKSVEKNRAETARIFESLRPSVAGTRRRLSR